MNSRQERALELMRAPLKDTEYRRRDLYELAGPGGSGGSGIYHLIRCAVPAYEPLSQTDVDGLVAAGLIEPKGPGCYRLASKKGQP